MSNEVNISTVSSGFLDPGYWVEWYIPRPNYDAARQKLAFFTIAPAPAIAFFPADPPQHIDLEITRTWNTAWWSGPIGGEQYVFQRNVRITNPPDQEGTAYYELLMAETDN